MAEYSATELKDDLGKIIIQQFKMQGMVAQRDGSEILRPNRILDEICEKLPNNSIVFLVDEYDASLTHHINQPEELMGIMKVLNSFYSVIKKHSGKFRFIFITGVTRVSQVSIFSAFNNLKDLSLSEEFNSLLGFSQNDLERYFDAYIENASKILNLEKKVVYERVEQYYAGFQFAINANQTLYNPWSIINFLDNPKAGFNNYWFNSLGTASILINYLKIKKDFDFLDSH